ncbi:MAG: methyltransferase [Actinomycetota bacterium]
MKRTIEEALTEARDRILRDDFVRAILTGRRKGKSPEFQRIDLRPVEIKGEVVIQSVAHDGKKDFTKNIDLKSAQVRETLDSGFANIIIDSTSESYQVQITKKEEAIVGLSKVRLERVLCHDREKERVLPESHPIFRTFGISDSAGRIKPTSRDKYIQIDQLLRILEPTLTAFEGGAGLRLVDLASGSAALTLSVHAFLSEKFEVETMGIERNLHLVDKSTRLVRDSGLTGIRFIESDIATAPREGIDIVLALHACDTATDDAIDFVIASKAKIALIVPCCQQSRGERVEEVARGFPLFGRDGIVDERLLDLATDALRGERLRIAGYSVDIVEFVGDEHTARNLLIRGVRR